MKTLNLTNIKTLENKLGFENIVQVGDLFFASKVSDLQQVKELKKVGVRNAVDLKQTDETQFEDKKEFELIGINYFHFPISNIQELDFDKVKTFSDLFNKLEGKTIIYCMSANRVGALMTMYTYLICGHPKERSVEFGKGVGMSKETLISSVEFQMGRFSA